MAITPLPTPPSRGNDAATFSARADALLGALPTFVTEANALQTDVNTKQASTATSETNAATSATSAATSAANAATSASVAVAATGAPMWVSGASYVVGNVVWAPADHRSYRRIVDGAGTTDPSADGANWAYVTVSEPMLLVTGAMTAKPGVHYVITGAGAITLTLPAVPAAGDEIRVTVANARADNIVARNGSPLIGLSEDMIINAAHATFALRYISAGIGWRFA